MKSSRADFDGHCSVSKRVLLALHHKRTSTWVQQDFGVSPDIFAAV